MKYGFGVDVGGTSVKIAYFDETGLLLDKWEIPTNTAENGKAIMPDIAASIAGYLEDHNIPRETILGIGLGVPAPVNAEGYAEPCVNLGWPAQNVSQALSELTGFPVRSGNDATNAALGECWKGGHNCDNMVFATLGTGVGGGIVIDGRVMHGVHGGGAEIGHIPLRVDAPDLCNCGKYGCAELYCSANGLVRVAGKIMEKDDTPSSLRSGKLTAKGIFDAGKAGDALALKILDRYYQYLAELLANICQVIDPEVVVLGGGVSRAGQMLIDGIVPYFRKLVVFGAVNIRFEIATLGNDAGAYGAFKLAVDTFLT
ncbi:MAG: ROK family glucokinase [Oscillospiraceae bacterium]|nr:ROK family glucokinase [Oscillospiraceae bacterium]